MMKTSIIIRTQFTGIHCWDNCSIPQVSFLKNPHRHIFFVEVKIPVFHDDRDLEFFLVKQALDGTIQTLYTWETGMAQLGSKSCEMIAKEIIEDLANEIGCEKITCSVFEDNENGAEAVWSHP